MSATAVQKATPGAESPGRQPFGSSNTSAPNGHTRAPQLLPKGAAEGRRAEGALGTSGNVSPHPSFDATGSGAAWRKTLERYRLRDRARSAWRMMGRLRDDDLFKTTRLCGLAPVCGRDGVEVRRLVGDDGVARAAILGTSSCGSANGVCPVCTARVREVRRRELQDMIRRGSELGYRFALVTGTLRHTRETTVAQQRTALEGAWRAVTTGKQAQQRRDAGTVVGTVRSVEFMLCGPAGPHGHVHAIVAIAEGVSETETAADFDAMGERWCSWAERNMGGLRPDDAHGWTWEYARNASDAADYVAKLVDGDGWNITHEVARGDTKRGQGGSLAPLQLLAKAIDVLERDGDIGPMLIMSEYARAVRGMRAIVVSRSFAKALRAPIDDRSDEEVAAEPEALGPDWQPAGFISTGAWLLASRTVGIGAVLDAAARDGARGVHRLIDNLRDERAP